VALTRHLTKMIHPHPVQHGNPSLVTVDIFVLSRASAGDLCAKLVLMGGLGKIERTLTNLPPVASTSIKGIREVEEQPGIFRLGVEGKDSAVHVCRLSK